MKPAVHLQGGDVKRPALILVLAAGCIPASALSMCSTIYGPNAAVIWRGTNAPIDLSGPVSAGMRRVFPSAYFLVIEDDNRGCSPAGPADYFGPMPGLTGPVPGAPAMQGGTTGAARPAR